MAGEGGPSEAADGPVGFALGADGFVEGDGGLIPIEDRPFHAAAAELVGEFREMEEEGFTEALAAKFGFNEKIFEVEAGLGEEGGVVKKIEGEAGGCIGCGEGEDACGGRALGGIGGEERGAEGRLRGDDLVGEFFVGGEAANEIENERDVGGGGGSDGGGHGDELAEKRRRGNGKRAVSKNGVRVSAGTVDWLQRVASSAW